MPGLLKPAPFTSCQTIPWNHAPFGSDDMIMDQLADKDGEFKLAEGDGKSKDDPAKEDDALVLTNGPMTRARTKY